MKGTINIEWDNVRNLSDRTKENFNRFEKSRERIEKIVETLPECWEGLDANAYESNINNYLGILKEDTSYFEYLSDYFNKMSTNIGGVVETYGEKFSRMNNDVSREKRNWR